MTSKELSLYFSQTKEEVKEGRGANSHASDYLTMFYELISMSNLFNRPKTVNTFIPKLGEFLDFPKIIFGTTLNFSASRAIDIQYFNTSNYKSPFKTIYKSKTDPISGEITYYQEEDEDFTHIDKQKQNVSLYGVIFRYHQLTLGWQQMLGDFQETFIVSRAKGSKHFILTLVDEYGRRIPNVDTSQGFKNNLKLELTCQAG